ncbi:MAG: GntR family transcriptional regulator, partial [Burkholderiales bacterium]|nr:GntR family transcriptional regulator [Burkholderiales bacterium]
MSDLRFLIEFQQYAADEDRSGRSATQQHRLYVALRDAILRRALSAGAVLPGTRGLATELGIARNSVIYAYEQLAAEGYVHPSRQGTVVSAVAQPVPGRRMSTSHRGEGGLSQRVRGLVFRRTPQDDLLPFRPGIPALDAFPLPAWQRALDRAGSGLRGDDLGYRYAMGEPELRQAIATYLRAARGVRCDSDQIVVTTGTQD